MSGSLVTEHAPRAVLLFADIGKLPGDCVCNRAIANGRVRLLLFLSATLSAACRRVHALMIFCADNALPALPDAVVKRHEMPSNLTISIITITGYTGILTGPILVGFIFFFARRTLPFSTTARLLLVGAANARLLTR
nr:MFS transporter [Erwinia sp. Ejp617]